MPRQGQLKGTPTRRAEFITQLRALGPGIFCVRWPWSDGRDGYARVHIDGQKVTAHRWVYEQINGPISWRHSPGAIGDIIRHTCDNRWCVRPSHLICGSQSENIRDAFEKGRMIAPSLRPGDRRRKLTDYDRAAIKALLANGATQHHVALAYGVSDATISRIKHS